MSVPKKLTFPIAVPVDGLAVLERSKRFYKKFLNMVDSSEDIPEIKNLPNIIKNSLPSPEDKREVKKLLANNYELTKIILDTFADYKDVK